MATPDFEHRADEVSWGIQPDYAYADNDSQFRCAMTGFPKRKDEIVYRGSHVDDFYGFFAIGQDSAEQLASLIGWVDPDDYDDPDAEVIAENESLREENEKLQAKLDSILAAAE